MTPRTSIRLAALALALGCGGYESTVRPVRDSLERGDRAAALKAVNAKLGVKSASETPAKFSDETALLLLERGAILHSLGRYQESARDLQEAEKHLELLDLSKDTAGSIGKYLYSDTATVYRAPAYEKLLLSTMNLLNYLCLGDLENARVEARRLTVMQDYLKGAMPEGKARFGLGSYLAGYTYEQSGRADEALRYYDDALQAEEYPSLREPVARLARASFFRTPRVEKILASAPAVLPAPQGADVLVVMSSGLVPKKEPERIPIGLAFAIAYDVTHPQYRMNEQQRRNADIVIAKSLLKWINFPELKKQPRRIWPAGLEVDGESAPIEPAMNVATRARQAYDDIKPMLIVSAVTRMVARAIAGEVSGKVAKEASGSGLLGLVVGLATEGVLIAADRPDTRAWTSVPAEVYLARVRVPPGPHRVEAHYTGVWGPRPVRTEVKVPSGFKVLSFVETQ